MLAAIAGAVLAALVSTLALLLLSAAIAGGLIFLAYRAFAGWFLGR